MEFEKKLKIDNFHSQRGFVALLISILILLAMITISVSISNLIIGQYRISSNILKSSQAYFTAEGGIEDALLRLTKNMKWSSIYTLSIGDNVSTVGISDVIGGARTITSEGEVKARIRKIQVVHQITTEKVSFYYGAQIGDGGMEMGNNARIEGNVFSNGSIISGKGYIDGTVKVATIGNRIEGLTIADDAYTHNCKNCTISGSLYFSGGSSQNCTSTEGIEEHPVQETKDLPIPASTIGDWKNDADEGEPIFGDYILDGKITAELGPKRITGSMTIDNGATLIMTGTIWVEGDILVKNGAIIKLDPNFYWGLSGILITDGKVAIKPGVSLEGSGMEGSYLLLLSTNSSLDKLSPAIEIDNTTVGGIFYTSNGLIVVKNKVEAREVTGYQILLKETALINYETGLADAEFSSGPGGSWQVTGWREIE